MTVVNQMTMDNMKDSHKLIQKIIGSGRNGILYIIQCIKLLGTISVKLMMSSFTIFLKINCSIIIVRAKKT